MKYRPEHTNNALQATKTIIVPAAITYLEFYRRNDRKELALPHCGFQTDFDGIYACCAVGTLLGLDV